MRRVNLVFALLFSISANAVDVFDFGDVPQERQRKTAVDRRVTKSTVLKGSGSMAKIKAGDYVNCASEDILSLMPYTLIDGLIGPDAKVEVLVDKDSKTVEVVIPEYLNACMNVVPSISQNKKNEDVGVGFVNIFDFNKWWKNVYVDSPFAKDHPEIDIVKFNKFSPYEKYIFCVENTDNGEGKPILGEDKKFNRPKADEFYSGVPVSSGPQKISMSGRNTIEVVVGTSESVSKKMAPLYGDDRRESNQKPNICLTYEKFSNDPSDSFLFDEADKAIAKVYDACASGSSELIQQMMRELDGNIKHALKGKKDVDKILDAMRVALETADKKSNSSEKESLIKEIKDLAEKVNRFDVDDPEDRDELEDIAARLSEKINEYDAEYFVHDKEVIEAAYENYDKFKNDKDKKTIAKKNLKEAIKLAEDLPFNDLRKVAKKLTTKKIGLKDEAVAINEFYLTAKAYSKVDGKKKRKPSRIEKSVKKEMKSFRKKAKRAEAYFDAWSGNEEGLSKEAASRISYDRKNIRKTVKRCREDQVKALQKCRRGQTSYCSQRSQQVRTLRCERTIKRLANNIEVNSRLYEEFALLEEDFRRREDEDEYDDYDDDDLFGGLYDYEDEDYLGNLSSLSDSDYLGDMMMNTSLRNRNTSGAYSIQDLQQLSGQGPTFYGGANSLIGNQYLDPRMAQMYQYQMGMPQSNAMLMNNNYMYSMTPYGY